MIEDSSNIGLYLCILFVTAAVGCIICYENVQEQEIKEARSIISEQFDQEVLEVTVNSPNIYVEVETLEKFREHVEALNSDVIYFDNKQTRCCSYFIVFNEGYTVGYRISVKTIQEAP